MDYYKEFTKQKIMLEDATSNPEISVDGLGTYDLETLISSTRRNLEELTDQITISDDARSWNNVKHLLDAGVIQAKVNAIVAAHEGIEQKRRRGGRPQKR